jgi:CRP-like cAMP-binding protein
MNPAARTVFQNNELLRHLDTTGIDRIASVASRRHYDHGAAIFNTGDPADGIYGVISGQVQVSAWTCNQDEIILQAYGSGRVFGMLGAIDGLPRCATARAAPTAEVFVICRDHFLRLLAADPLLLMSLVTVLCRSQRLAAQMLIAEYAQRRVPARLAHRVLELTERRASCRNGSDACLEITQADLAKFVFASRQVVNHYLREWEGRGWISMSRGRLSVIDRLALVRMATNGALHEDADAGEPTGRPTTYPLAATGG